ncbi:MAG: haloacid dehalogenase, partial [Candidatus Aenigmarchaeota archaeon]|nr:haloacid dehalogenase [Candidatus Aenigmarchaeota archaeon]
MIKAIFFDFDGVLTTDSRGSYTTSTFLEKKTGISKEKILSCYRHNFPLVKTTKLSYKDFWQDFCKCIGKDIDIGPLRGAFDSTPKNERMFDLAEKLKTNYKTGIITDNSKERFDAM